MTVSHRHNQPGKPRTRFWGRFFDYLIRDDIQWHIRRFSVLPEAPGFDLVIDRRSEASKKLSSQQIGEISAAVLVHGIGLPLKGGSGKLSEYITKVIDEYGLGSTNTFRISVPIWEVANQYDELAFKAYLTELKEALEKQPTLHPLIASGNFAGGKSAIKGASKETGGGAAAKPKRSDWAQEKEEQLKKLIDQARKQKPAPKDLPDHVTRWYNERDKRWYLNIWVFLDTAGEQKTGYPLQLRPDETGEQLLERVRSATARALQRVEDREQRERSKEAPAWARRLEEGLQSAHRRAAPAKQAGHRSSGRHRSVARA